MPESGQDQDKNLVVVTKEELTLLGRFVTLTLLNWPPAMKVWRKSIRRTTPLHGSWNRLDQSMKGGIQ